MTRLEHPTCQETPTEPTKLNNPSPTSSPYDLIQHKLSSNHLQSILYTHLTATAQNVFVIVGTFPCWLGRPPTAPYLGFSRYLPKLPHPAAEPSSCLHLPSTTCQDIHARMLSGRVTPARDVDIWLTICARSRETIYIQVTEKQAKYWYLSEQDRRANHEELENARKNRAQLTTLDGK